MKALSLSGRPFFYFIANYFKTVHNPATQMTSRHHFLLNFTLCKFEEIVSLDQT